MANLNGSATTGNINSNGAGGATTTNKGATMTTTNSSTGRLYAAILGTEKVPPLASVFAARTGMVCPNGTCPLKGEAAAEGSKFCKACGSQLVEGTVCSSKDCGHAPGVNAVVIKDGGVFTAQPICTTCEAELPQIRTDLPKRGQWAKALVGALVPKFLIDAQKRAAELTARPKVEKQPAQPAPAPKVEAAPVAAPAPVVVVESKPALNAVQKLEADRQARREARSRDNATVRAAFNAWLSCNALAPFVAGTDISRCAMKHDCCGGGATKFLDYPEVVGLCDSAGNMYIQERKDFASRYKYDTLPYLCATLEIAKKQNEEKAKKAAEREAAEKERAEKAAAEKDANFTALTAAFNERQLPVRDPKKPIKVFAGIAVPGEDGVYKPFTLNTFELAAYRRSGETKEIKKGGEVFYKTFYPFGRYYAANDGKGITLEDALAQCQADCERFTKDPPKPYVARTESEVTEAAPAELSPEAQAAKDEARRKREAEREAKRDADRERGKKNKGGGGGKGGGGDKGGKKEKGGKGGGGGVSSKVDFGMMGQAEADRIRLGGGGLGGRQ